MSVDFAVDEFHTVILMQHAARDHGIKLPPRETHPLRDWLKDLHGLTLSLPRCPFNLESGWAAYLRPFFFFRPRMMSRARFSSSRTVVKV